jgi:2-hydroxy-3-oxopropionate reductase
MSSYGLAHRSADESPGVRSLAAGTHRVMPNWIDPDVSCNIRPVNTELGEWVQEMTEMTIGFIGLGDIGKPMAANLLDKGFGVASSANRSRQAFEELIPKGLVEKENPRRVAETSEVLITMVMDEAQTETVLRGKDGAIGGLRPGTSVIVMSTLRPDYCKELAQELAGREITVLDCPVSGMAARAADGTLTLMAGGDIEAIENVSSVLDAMGTVTHCGEIGMGMVAKLANNGISMVAAGLLVEMRRMAAAYGMDLPTLMEILKTGTAASFVVDNFELLRPHWQQFAKVADKDMRICKDAGLAQGTPTPILDAWLTVDWRGFKPDEF